MKRRIDVDYKIKHRFWGYHMKSIEGDAWTKIRYLWADKRVAQPVSQREQVSWNLHEAIVGR